jgi:hypothetical protein
MLLLKAAQPMHLLEFRFQAVGAVGEPSANGIFWGNQASLRHQSTVSKRF